MKTEDFVKLIQDAMLEIRGNPVLLDSDVANFYGVETKRINESVKNNPDKFPEGYIIKLSQSEWNGLKKDLENSKQRHLRSNISTAKFSKVRTPPNVYTERGLYMLATILKSSLATEATLAIIEAYAKFRDLSSKVKKLSECTNSARQKSLMKHTSSLLTELLDNQLVSHDSETSIEINFALLKIKHSVKRAKNG